MEIRPACHREWIGEDAWFGVWINSPCVYAGFASENKFPGFFPAKFPAQFPTQGKGREQASRTFRPLFPNVM